MVWKGAMDILARIRFPLAFENLGKDEKSMIAVAPSNKSTPAEIKNEAKKEKKGKYLLPFPTH